MIEDFLQRAKLEILLKVHNSEKKLAQIDLLLTGLKLPEDSLEHVDEFCWVHRCEPLLGDLLCSTLKLLVDSETEPIEGAPICRRRYFSFCQCQQDPAFLRLALLVGFKGLFVFFLAVLLEERVEHLHQQQELALQDSEEFVEQLHGVVFLGQVLACLH